MSGLVVVPREVHQQLADLRLDHPQAEAAWRALGLLEALVQVRPDRQIARDAYATLRAILCYSPLGGYAGWPLDFWSTPIGRLLYRGMLAAYGADLLTQSETARRLGLANVSLVAREQREGRLDYVVDADARNPRHHSRRVSVDMVAAYLAAAAA